MAEQLTLNQLVGSSSLPRLTSNPSTTGPVRTAWMGSLIWAGFQESKHIASPVTGRGGVIGPSEGVNSLSPRLCCLADDPALPECGPPTWREAGA